ncbi:hypothetical protein ACFSM5_17095 [Lacibacterium aquatile]|uniref:Lipoprotein n=1 Tax=Lacibacterium aquatile TaxID=1168082 RepID=A0ABW5DVV7_9PROT
MAGTPAKPGLFVTIAAVEDKRNFESFIAPITEEEKTRNFGLRVEGKGIGLVLLKPTVKATVRYSVIQGFREAGYTPVSRSSPDYETAKHVTITIQELFASNTAGMIRYVIRLQLSTPQGPLLGGQPILVKGEYVSPGPLPTAEDWQAAHDALNTAAAQAITKAFF